MAELVHVKEAAGRVTRMPNGKRLPDGGALVEKSIFIMRCIADGDLEVVPAPAPAQAEERAS